MAKHMERAAQPAQFRMRPLGARWRALHRPRHAGRRRISCGRASPDVEVYDRQDGTTLRVYEKDGRRYVVGTPGHEYALRMRNLTGARILAVTSVDGVNVVTGETASPDQSGYVVDAWGSVEIAGWRKSLQNTAAFYFTDLGDSYAARTGRPATSGVIGVAVFRERERPPSRTSRSCATRLARAMRPPPAPAARRAVGATRDAQPRPRRWQARDESRRGRRMPNSAKAPRRPTARRSAPATDAANRRTRRRSRSSARRSSPSEVLQRQLRPARDARGDGRAPAADYARRGPQPFPGAVTFVPDPR